MTPSVSVERVEPTAEDGTVCHVDQLTERERDCLQRLSRDDHTADIDWRTAAALSEFSSIKSSEYVRVTYHDPSDSGRGIGANS
jgi:hypothetical protein